ncbi:tripartite tricarboxylate transporter substrate binding protein [Gracilibacillus suaedae]|uniref:tripartite tricarboxylate transporter substrate binding protein n=1 Tax=Gracilibacillus suaedae TaxID=2820273 RepID=UPI001ABE4F29|nr:tripartite tricarboxylate transporter substrate binding protein [Gracilibacillus suaedae]
MKKLMISICIVAIGGLLSACGSSNSSEDSSNFPENQIEVVVPFAAGGASDLVSRTIATEMENELDVPVVVSNKTGGSGTTGMLATKDAKPDGYTIGYVPVELAMVQELGLAEIAPNDYQAIGQLMTIPAAITVSADAPYDTIEEFISYAEENPGEVKVGNSGTGSIWHIAAAAFAQELDLELEYIPYDGAAPAVTALMGGHVDAVSVSPSEVVAGLDSEDLKVLAVMSEERDANVPDVPTLQELGYDINLSGWGGFVAPTDTPDEVMETLQSAFKIAAESEAFTNLLEERGMNPNYKDGAEFQQFAQDQYEYFSELIPSIDLSN